LAADASADSIDTLGALLEAALLAPNRIRIPCGCEAALLRLGHGGTSFLRPKEATAVIGMDIARIHPGRRSDATAYAVTGIAVALATLAAVIVDRAISVPNLSLVFVLPVVFSAASFGFGPALAAAVAGVVAYNFFLIEPRYTFRVAQPANIWALALLLTTAAVVSAVAADARRRALEAWAAAAQASTLQTLARALVGESTRAGVAARCAEALSQLFRAPAVLMLHEEGGLRPLGIAGGAAISEADAEAAGWSLASGCATRGGAYPVADSRFDFWPVVTPQRQRAAIGLMISEGEEGRPDAPERLVEIVGGYLSVALDREAYARQVLDNRVQIASERLKADLLAAVSHDLKTPLSTILFTLQSLRTFDAAHDAKTRAELLSAAEAETSRLSRMVENLLDMNRIEAGALPLRPAPADPADLVAAAIARARPALENHRIVNEVTGGSPLMVDEALFESALANLLENAAKYSPEGSEVCIRAGCNDGVGWVEVLDEGPGLGGAPERLFEKFARGRPGDGRPPGTGLGLSIARGFLEAQGGRVEAEDRQDRRGARVRLLAPLA
jgi:two-component system sensor histidine kinase KdpD